VEAFTLAEPVVERFDGIQKLDQEKIAQRYAQQLSAKHRVDAALYSAAEHAFGQRGLVEITYLTGIA